MAQLRRYKSFHLLKLTTKASQPVSPEAIKRHDQMQAFIGILRQELVKHTATDKPVQDGK